MRQMDIAKLRLIWSRTTYMITESYNLRKMLNWRRANKNPHVGPDFTQVCTTVDDLIPVLQWLQAQGKGEYSIIYYDTRNDVYDPLESLTVDNEDKTVNITAYITKNTVEDAAFQIRPPDEDR